MHVHPGDAGQSLHLAVGELCTLQWGANHSGERGWAEAVSIFSLVVGWDQGPMVSTGKISQQVLGTEQRGRFFHLRPLTSPHPRLLIIPSLPFQMLG